MKRILASVASLILLSACVPVQQNADSTTNPQAQTPQPTVRSVALSGEAGVTGSAAILTWPNGEHEVFLHLEGLAPDSGVYANHIHFNNAGDANCAAQNGDQIIGLTDLVAGSDGVAWAYSKLASSVAMPAGAIYLNVHSNSPDPVGGSLACGDIQMASTARTASFVGEGGQGTGSVIQRADGGLNVLLRLSKMTPSSGVYANHIHFNNAGDANCAAQNGDQVIGLSDLEPDKSGIAWAFSALASEISYPSGNTYINVHSNTPDPVGPSISCGDVN